MTLDTDETFAETLAGAGADASSTSLDKPSTIGRYHVLRQIGEGAMGTIYLGYDESLDRRVAVKVHRGLGPEQQATLQREAQAMARLSDPNVAPVYEVGEFGERLFIAMEYVQGQRLSQWQRQSGRTRDEILDAYLQAGRGLAAAHAVGVVHRDFKPDNVLVGDDGRVRVVDFGLARPDAATPTWSPDADPADDDAPISQQTRYGLGGTPAYMSPEQFRREPPAAASDQFGYCVALYEALYGQRPFQGDDAASAAYHVPRGDRRPRPADADVPGRIAEALDRGLSVKAADRFASMNELLQALSPPRVGRVRLVAATLVVGGLAGAAVAYGFAAPAAADPCADAGQALGTAWDESRREQVRQAILGTKTPFAEDTWTRLDAELGAYAEHWRAAAGSACEATRVQGAQTQAQLGQRMACLDRRRRALQAVAEVLADADASVAEHALDAARQLPAIEPCRDLEYVAAALPPPDDPAVAADVDEIRAELSRASALQLAGKLQDAVELATSLLPRARETNYEPLVADALERLGRALAARGDSTEAAQHLEDAYALATKLGHTETAGSAASRLVVILGSGLTRFEAAHVWETTAMAMAQAQGPESEAMDEALSNAAGLAYAEGKYRASIDYDEQAREIAEQRLGPRAPRVGALLANIGSAYRELGEYDRAADYDARALQIAEAAYGPEHPNVATALGNLAAVQRDRGDLPAAEAGVRRAIEILALVYGPRHPNVASVRSSLAAILLEQGKLDAAETELRDVVAIHRDADPDGHLLAQALTNLGTARHAQGDPEEAEKCLREAVEVYRRALGPEHPDLALPLRNLGTLLMLRHDYDDAHQMLTSAYAVWLATKGPEHPDGAQFLFSLGQTEFHRGNFATARDTLQRALDLADDTVPQRTRTMLRFWLGRATWPLDASAGRALAQAALAELPDEDARGRGDMQRWLDEHPAK